MTLAQLMVATLGYIGLIIAAGYSITVLAAAIIWKRHISRARLLPAKTEPVTILKPVCGAEPDLYEHLRSFCRQDYPQFQIVFGTLDPEDSALPIVRRLANEFPDLTIDVVVNPRRHGHNNKSNNLINMMAKARHPLLLIADSDITVQPDYLMNVTAPLADARVGLVTCLSHDCPTATFWSRLGAMYINEWYFPSVMLAWLGGHQGFASGQTLCLRRATLAAIGGLDAFVDHIADDYQLGHLIRGLGLKTFLSPYEVEAQHHETDLAALSCHELRWMRVLHSVSPWSFRMIFLTFSLPLALIGLALTLQVPGRTVIWALFGLTVCARLGLHFVHRLGRGYPLFGDLVLVPLRDVLLCALWAYSFFARTVTWRGAEFRVDAAGVMRRVA